MQPVPADDGSGRPAAPSAAQGPPEQWHAGGFPPAVQAGAGPVGDRVPLAAVVVLWVGLLVNAVLAAVPDPSTWSADQMRTVWLIADGLYVVALGVTGLLSRRNGLAPGGPLAWLGGGLIVLLLLDVFFPRLAARFAWGGDEALTIYWGAAAVAVTLFALGWFAVRRSPGVRYAFVPVVLVVELAWFLGVRQVFENGASSAIAYRLESAVMISGGTALMAVVVLLSGKVGGRSAALALPAGPGWPAQQQWTGQQTGWTPEQWPAQRPARTNTLAVVALVLGIVGVNIAAIVCGHVALSQIRRTGESGRGMAIAGLVLGYLWVAVVVILLVGVASFASSSGY